MTKMIDRPLASPGLTSFRCKNRYGWTMIGASDCADALNQAKRSFEGSRHEDLQKWNGESYMPIQSCNKCNCVIMGSCV